MVVVLGRSVVAADTLGGEAGVGILAQGARDAHRGEQRPDWLDRDDPDTGTGARLVVGKVVGVRWSASTPFGVTAGGGSVDDGTAAPRRPDDQGPIDEVSITVAAHPTGGDTGAGEVE